MLANKLALAVSAVYSEPQVSFVPKFTDEDYTTLLTTHLQPSRYVSHGRTTNRTECKPLGGPRDN